MKALKIIIYISFLAVMFASCADLNPLPKDRLASELFWKTTDDAIFASNGVYSILGGQWRYTSMDAYSDISHFVLQWRAESQMEKHTFDASSNVVADEWSHYYRIVQAANTFLENVDLVEELEVDLKSRLIAEVKTLRAFAYINLVMFYGDVPLLITNPDIQEAKSITRTSANEIWNFISEELSSSSVNLPIEQIERGRVTKGVALGLKARAMLYAGRYQEAKLAAKAVMDMEAYKIYESYAKLFDYEGETASEIMFARQYAKNLNAHEIFNFYVPNSLYTQRCQAVPTKKLVDAYLMKTTGLPIENPASGFDPKNPYTNRDPRLNHTVYVSGDKLPDGMILNTLPGNGSGDDISISAENVTPTGWYFKKYVNDADYVDPYNCGVNLVYLRYAEILLTYAEASVELGEINQSVLNALNEIRKRPDVNMPEVTTLDQTELREIIRRERMVELAMEGHRLFDIRRWRIGEEVIPGTVKGMTYENSGGVLVTVELSGYVKEFKKDRHYLWPIPFREIDLNPNLIQNTGY
ncbi:RagB/SusD family nutrient uptake outer membrane protein [Massilibacteroides vaginae]|uniref:RagB/SusD family nutrient uptake outer membrane protein n=1 Tax=Massilibacteroides vaginae TaxID=1673718 RepID=UPI000A1C9B63|nr:RagB/SusD family nutrient uptake outer membrane protein [Massilibacteroides vaginae]